jgi:hypothetical protein
MNCFGTRKAFVLLACDADGKGVCNFYREMLSPKEIVVNNSHFLTIFKKNKWLFNLILS